MEEITDVCDASAARSFLYDRIDYERNAAVRPRSKGLRLDRMRDLLARLGNPHQRLKIVHIAGTKGKGSTAAMIASILVQADFRVGLYTSPHLQHLEERFVVDQRPCSRQQLVDLVEHVRSAVMDLDQQRDADDEGLTFFEITTAMAFVFFDQEAVQIAVVEVGMGGRLDSTNVCDPLVSVITNISLDHTRQLGNTLASIATEKAGIIKPGVPVVSGVVPTEPRDAIARVAASRHSRLFELNRDFHFDFTPPSPTDPTSTPQGLLKYSEDGLNEFHNRDEIDDPVGSSDSVDGRDTNSSRGQTGRRTLTLRPGLLGRHQAANASVAVAAIGRLKSLGWRIPDDAIMRGIATANCPARIEVLATQPWVILDTAHNTASIAALIDVLKESFVAHKRCLIFAATRDKDVRGMLCLLRFEFDSIILTQYHNNPRSVPPTELAELLEELNCESANARPADQTIAVAADPASAWRMCQSEVDADSLVCITGSFFLAAEIRDSLTRGEDSPAGVSG